MVKIVQDIKVEIKSLKKMKTEIKLKIKNLGSKTKTSVVSFTKSVQEMEEKI